MSTALQEPKQVNGTLYTPHADEDKAQFDLAQREATALSRSTWTPKHLIGRTQEETVATCLGLVTMAKKWNMSAQMVAGETYSVHGKIGFQGKLYAALANAHGGLVGGLRSIYSGKGDSMAAVIFGSDHALTDADKEMLRKFLKDGNSDAATELELNNVKAIRVIVAQCETDQAMWKNDPEQKLFYTGSTKWCRKFMPDLVLGAISVEDLERIEYVTGGFEAPESRTAVLESKLGGMLGQSEVKAKVVYPLPANPCPEDPSEPMADFWKRMTALTEDHPLRALSDEIAGTAALGKEEKQLLWDEISRRVGP